MGPLVIPENVSISLKVYVSATVPNEEARKSAALFVPVAVFLRTR